MDAGTGVLTLAGVGLGAWLTSGRERTAWLRDKRLEAYVDFVTAARHMLYKGDEIRADQPEQGEKREAVRRAMQHVRDVATAVSLVAPDDVRTSLERVKTYLGHDLFEHFMSLPHTGDAPEVERARDLVADFEATARKSLSRALGWRERLHLLRK